jgi:hypothetical protein
MQNTTRDAGASELSYQGPLIGMRSTRTESSAAKTTTKKPPASEKSSF